MTAMMPGQEATINRRHPFYGGVKGVFEFSRACGGDKKIIVMSHPRRNENEPKVLFMIRPEDAANHASMLRSLVSQGDDDEPVIDVDPIETPEFVRAEPDEDEIIDMPPDPPDDDDGKLVMLLRRLGIWRR